MSPETIFERWVKDTGFGTTPGQKGVSREDLIAHEPRDERGRWTDRGVSGDVAGNPPNAAGLFTAAGIPFGPTGSTTTLTDADAKGFAQAVEESVKKFPELKKPLPKSAEHGAGTPLVGVEFATNPQDKWARASKDQLMIQSEFGQITGAATGINPEEVPLKTRIQINDDLNAGDGIHVLPVAGKEHGKYYFGPGTRTVKGQLIHELGHAVVRAAGLEVPDHPEVADGKLAALYDKYDLTALTKNMGIYSASNPSEAFGELYAAYMANKLKPADRQHFEALLNEILERKK